MYLKVSPQHLVTHGSGKRKLKPRYIGPYPIVERVGHLAYRLKLPPSLSGIHNVFHVSQLQRQASDLTLRVRVETIELRNDLTYPESPGAILDRRTQVLQKKEIQLVKVQWGNDEATWELEETIRKKYPHLFEEMEIKVCL